MAFNKQKALEAARKYRDKGHKDKAIKEYLKVVREDPKDVRVWLKIGDLYAQKGAKQEATETYLKVAKFYGEQGFYLKAVAVYKQILKLDARMVEVNLKLAELYRQLGLISDAMQHFEMVAGFFHREGKTQEALATIRQLVDLDPENVATRIKLAELYSKEKMSAEAVAEFQHACDYLKRNGREDDYVKVAERLLWHKPERVDLARELAGLYLKRRDPRRALQKLQACFKADQRDVETLALLAQAFQALEQKGKTVSVLKELARVLTENGQRQQAEEVHRKILAYVPDDPDSLSFVGAKPPTAPAPRPRAERLASIADGARGSSSSRVKQTGAVPIVEEPSEEGLAADLSLDEGPNLANGSSASGEVHADEIVKILTETDVYVKYGLHQKAVTHLQRVFELDAENIEARERLKDIYVSQGRTDDAIAELTNLAEQAVSGAPDRAEMYLREALDLDPNNEGAVDLARRFRLDITKALTAAPVEIVDEFSEAVEFDLGTGHTGATQQLDDVLDFDDLDVDDELATAPPAAPVPPPETLEPDAFQDLELAAPASSSQVESPQHLGDVRAPSEYDLDFDGGADEPADSTMELSLEEAEEMVSPVSEELDFDRQPGGGFGESLAPDSLEERLDAALAAEDERLTIGERPTAPQTVGAGFAPANPYEEVTAPDLSDSIDSTQDVSLADVEEIADLSEVEEIHDISELGGAMLEDSAEHQQVADVGAAEHEMVADPTQEVRVDNIIEEVASDGGGIDDELDEADFYISQGLLEEAKDILANLESRSPGNPLVQAKMQELEEAEAASLGSAPDLDATADSPVAPAPAPAPDEPGKPAVIVGNSVDDADAATHFDLGQAYREMGLLDESVKEFEKVLAANARQVQCHLMIGLCYRDQDKLSEAITQFKAGLYVSDIKEAEKFGLYYEIGVSYESLSDPQEALYYYEMLAKKDPDYRDIAGRIKSIKGAGGERRGNTLDEDTDAALDSLK